MNTPDFEAIRREGVLSALRDHKQKRLNYARDLLAEALEADVRKYALLILNARASLVQADALHAEYQRVLVERP